MCHDYDTLFMLNPTEHAVLTAHTDTLVRFPCLNLSDFVFILLTNFKMPSNIVSMISKYHNQKLHTNPWHREEPQNNHETPGRQKSKATSSLFLIKMVAKIK